MEDLQGVCKDCGNGTLNNELNPAFEVEYGWGTVVCKNCGSTHVDILPQYSEETTEAL